MPANANGFYGMTLCGMGKWSWLHVFVRCLQNMLGVIIFVRISWITHEVGLGMTILFIFLGFLISFLTTMSVEAICTEQGFGLFATMSKYATSAVSAGLSVLYVFSNVLAFAMFVVAAAETLVNALRNSELIIMDGSINDMRIFSAVLCVNVLLVALLRSSEHFCSRLSMTILVLSAVFIQIIGLLMPSLIVERRIKSTAFKISDFNPYDEKAMGFVVYFPAVTCVFTGLSMGVSVAKDDVFRGTTVALVLSSLLYVVTASLEAHFISISPLVLTHTTIPENGVRSMAVLKSLPVTVVVILSCFYCAYTALITAGRTVQDVGNRGGLVPGWDKLGRAYGREAAPRIAFTVITVAAIVLSMIGEFNIIASMMTIFFLTTYCLFNYSVFMATLQPVKPVFRRRCRWLALVCSLLCVHIMLAVSWKLTNAAIFTFLKFYIYIKWKQSQSQVSKECVRSSYARTLSGLQSMEREKDRGYKPQVLLLTGNPAARPALVDFANNIIMGRSLLICGFVIPQQASSSTFIITRKVDKQMSMWLENRRVDAFPATVANKNQAEGVVTLLQTSGIGKMRPNILMLGFKNNWEEKGESNLDEIVGFYEIVLSAFESDVGVAIFRNSNIGFDLTERFSRKDDTVSSSADENGIDINPYSHCTVDKDSRKPSQKVSRVADVIRASTSFIRGNNNAVDFELTDGAPRTKNRFELDSKWSVDFNNADLVGQLERFRTRIHKGTIDDGGLTVLLAYLLQLPGTYLEGARLRVFIEGDLSDRVPNDQKCMATLLRKFGVNSSDLNVISVVDRSPNKTTVGDFERLISAFKENGSDRHGLVTEEELQSFQQKTTRHLRTSELLQEHSYDADLVVITIPMPRRSTMSAALYLSWLEMISRNLPPTLLVRGNRTSVLNYFD